MPQIFTTVKTLLPTNPGAINKDIATPMLKAGTNRIKATKADILDIKIAIAIELLDYRDENFHVITQENKSSGDR